MRFYQNENVHNGFTLEQTRVLVAEKWANIKYERGRNALSSYALTQSQNLTVTVRYDKALNEQMELEYEGSAYRLTKPVIDRSEGSMQFIAELITDDNV